MASLAGRYAKFRGSRGFLLGLVVFVGIWLTFHFIFGFDTDFGELNTILSTEASVSLAFFTMVSDVQSEWVKTIIVEIKDMGQAVLDISYAQKEVLVSTSNSVDLLFSEVDMLKKQLAEMSETLAVLRNRE